MKKVLMILSAVPLGWVLGIAVVLLFSAGSSRTDWSILLAPIFIVHFYFFTKFQIILLVIGLSQFVIVFAQWRKLPGYALGLSTLIAIGIMSYIGTATLLRLCSNT